MSGMEGWGQTKRVVFGRERVVSDREGSCQTGEGSVREGRWCQALKGGVRS